VNTIVLLCLVVPLGLAGYAYGAYPVLLFLASRVRPRPSLPAEGQQEWPSISITVPAYNEAATIGAMIESLLAIDYPADRRQILVVSDCSNDGTDEIVRKYAARGVELLRTKERGGKTAAENAAAPHLRGEIVVNTDASIRILPDALKPLIRVFRDPTVGVASGRDKSVGAKETDANRAETRYVGYEMAIRSLETRVGTIIGASGCFYAIRHHLHGDDFPAHLSRDFASAMIAIRNGLRAVSVDSAVCLVPRTPSLKREFRRKIRTMQRGLETLWHMRTLLNPLRYPLASFMLLSHKVCRWLVPLAGPIFVVGLALLAVSSSWAAIVLALIVAATAVGLFVLLGPDRARIPRPVAACAFVVGGVAAGCLAWYQLAIRQKNATWEPTRRDPAPTMPA
jgi:cellulose synthase/poly-beta-1,6-N-acetylglucosamine synthase-like glycosyltransferase